MRLHFVCEMPFIIVELSLWQFAQRNTIGGILIYSFSTVWKETHVCSINGLINGLHLIVMIATVHSIPYIMNS